MSIASPERIRIAIDASEAQRRQLRIEAMQRGMSLRAYIQAILDRRHELEIIEEKVID